MAVLEATPAAELTFVKQSRIIRASRARVWEAWTNPEMMKQWMGPANRYCPEARLDVREGGAYFLQIDAKPGVEMPEGAPRGSSAEGVYTVVEPVDRLQFTWRPSFNPGEESMVTVTFANADGGTEVTILHERVTAQGCAGYGSGWAGSLEKLDELLVA